MSQLPRGRGGDGAQGWQPAHPGSWRGRAGLRDWLTGLGQVHTRGAAFDTRLGGAPMLTGRASKAIAKLLERHGIALLAPAESFLVTKDNQLRHGEQARAEQWGRELAALLPTGRPTG